MKTVRRPHPNTEGAHVILDEETDQEPHADLLQYYERKEPKTKGSGHYTWVVKPEEVPAPSPAPTPKKAKG